MPTWRMGPSPCTCVPGSHPRTYLSGRLDRSKLSRRHCRFFLPKVVDGALISEASVVFLDPTSAEEVLSVQLQSREILATRGLITLRPRQLIEGIVVDGENATANATHYSLEALECTKSLYLGRRGSIVGTGSIVPPCTFTQSVTPHAGSPSIFYIHCYPPPGSMDDGGVELSFYWTDQLRQPSLPRLGASNWPSSLSLSAVEVLSQFPQTFHRELNPLPLHGTDIAGESFQLGTI
jgi:hypothetical protein